MSEVGAIRGLDVNEVEKVVNRRNAWRNNSPFARFSTLITPQQTNNLINVCGYLHSVKDRIKIMISYNYCYVYTNDLTIAGELHANPYVQYRGTSEAVVDRPVGTIKLNDPKWSHRTFFKDRSISDATQEQLVRYLQGRKNIRMSPGLITWFNETNQWRKTWLQSYFFIDHNNDGELLLLNIAAPGLIGKTCTIVAK